MSQSNKINDLSKKDRNDVLPWTEKYRPPSFDQIISHKTVIDVLNKTIDDNMLPHLLFYGPSGVGKTSVVMACARKLYGDKMDLMMLNINASEERGIEVVRNRIQQFVNAKIIHSENNKSIFKLVILDEADAMTSDAQAMLRKVIEKYSYCTRFCLICNYIKKITPALQSRCACYRFPPLKAEDIRMRVLYVAKKEGINVTEEGISTIIKRSKGDMRKVLNILQSTSMSYSIITDVVVNRCIGYPNVLDISKIMNSLTNDTFEASFNLILDIKTKNSYSLQDIISEVSGELIKICGNPKENNYDNFNPVHITSILKIMSDIEYNLTTCVTESLQLSALVAAFKLNA
jgi:replication factor C subunit 3/5